MRENKETELPAKTFSLATELTTMSRMVLNVEKQNTFWLKYTRSRRYPEKERINFI